MIDFHIHSNFSDGTYSPAELVDLAVSKNLNAIALTDHDTISGLELAQKRAVEQNIDFVNGIELSVDYYGKEVHILGLFIDVKNPELVNEIEKLKSDRLTRTKIIIEKLKKSRIYLDEQEILKNAESDVVSRVHIANEMRRKGYVYSMREAFSNYLGSNGSAYLAKDNLSPKRAVELIRVAGGLSFIAHPKLIPLRRKTVLELIYDLMKIGLNGLEVFYPGFTLMDIEYYKKICKENDLLLTGGSDFHGKNRDEIGLGEVKIPDEIYIKMKDKIKLDL